MFLVAVMPSKRSPGSFSTMKQLMPSGVRAASATTPARTPFVTHIFVPSTTYSSPSGVARQRSAWVSLPASGSESDRHPPLAASPSPAGARPLLVGAVASDEAGGDEVGVDDAESDIHRPTAPRRCGCR
jgi:hypothetical protein